jgi:hypothetical protein
MMNFSMVFGEDLYGLTYVFVEIVMNRLSAAAAAETPSHRRYPAFSAQAI